MSPHICIGEGILLATLMAYFLIVQSASGCAIGVCKEHFDVKPVDECQTNEDTKELCQRCAKKTKSGIVYPMCCEGTEEAREFCLRYINFGLQERHLLSSHY